MKKLLIFLACGWVLITVGCSKVTQVPEPEDPTGKENLTAFFGTAGGRFVAIDAYSGAEKWSFETDGYVQATLSTLDNVGIESSPTYVNGLIYFGSDDKKLYALDAESGRKKWAFTTGDKITASPTVIDGVVYVGSNDGYLYAIETASGSQKWRFRTDGNGYFSAAKIHASATVANQTVFVGDFGEVSYGQGGRLYAIDVTSGKQKWVFDTQPRQAIKSSPAVWNNTVFVGTTRIGSFKSKSRLYAIDATTGKQKWVFDLEDGVDSSPTIVNGVLFIGCKDGNLYAIDAVSGTKKWTFKTERELNSSPTVDNNFVYTVSEDGYLYALDAASGAKKWDVDIGSGPITASPTVANNVVYVLGGGYPYAFHALTGKKLANHKIGGGISSSPCIIDKSGRVFHSSVSGVNQ
jgi:outer membrane protein assembly factor BamB